jgi:DNA-binding NarL/FixJ family response regulator
MPVKGKTFPVRELDQRCRRPDDGGLSARVLIVDDSPAFRDAARELLEARGYVVVGEAADAAAAVDAARRLAPDGVLLDVRLSGGSGLDLAAELTRAHRDLAILLVSADRHPPSREQLAGSGARGFLFKSQLVRANLADFWPEP